MWKRLGRLTCRIRRRHATVRLIFVGGKPAREGIYFANNTFCDPQCGLRIVVEPDERKEASTPVYDVECTRCGAYLCTAARDELKPEVIEDLRNTGRHKRAVRY